MATDQTSGLEARVTTLEEQMAEVLTKPAFRRKTERGVCTLGNEPSESCPEASLGRMQGGCHGLACLAEGQTYYKNYRARRKAEKALADAAPAKKATRVSNPRKKGDPSVKSGTIKRAEAPAKKKAAPARIKRRGA